MTFPLRAFAVWSDAKISHLSKDPIRILKNYTKG